MSLPVSNLFLLALSPPCRQQLNSISTAVSLPLRSVLYEADETPAYAYFLTSGIASVVTPMMDGGIAEVEIIGREGVVGGVHLLGSIPVTTRCFMQMEGTALRIALPDLKRAFRTSDEIRNQVLELIQAEMLVISQVAGCNRLHEAEARLARWLLMISDRTGSDTLHFTQEFLAEMLGAQRTTVTMVAGALQRSGFISYRHGLVQILDREGLEQAACDCYRVTRKIFDSLYRRPLA